MPSRAPAPPQLLSAQDVRPTNRAIVLISDGIAIPSPPVPNASGEVIQAAQEARVRSATSVFSQIGGLDEGLARLRDDLASGAGQRRYGDLLSRAELDIGYRMVVWWRGVAD